MQLFSRSKVGENRVNLSSPEDAYKKNPWHLVWNSGEKTRLPRCSGGNRGGRMPPLAILCFKLQK